MALIPLNEIVDALQARAEDVARAYAPGGTVQGGRYWALDPGRQDTSIGSFYVGLQGQFAGRWRDEATGESGDMLDLIMRSLGRDKKAAIEEAKQFLGLATETEAQRRARLRQQEVAQKRQAEDAARDAEKRARRARQAHAIYMEASPQIEGTPVQWYLEGRAISFDRLGRVPRAVRYHPDLRYYHIDKKTGEVTEGSFPAMVAPIYGGWTEGQDRPRFIGIHKTFLQRGPDGRWTKADVPKPKLIWGTKKGGFIRIWSGQGPRGGKGPALSKMPPGGTLYVTEGIEDALSVAVLDPSRHVAAAIDLGNIREMNLHPNVSVVWIVADNDPDPALASQIDRAARRFHAEGRAVMIWRNHHGGKDINDALVAATKQEGAA